ncbi:molecular chaperone [Pseudomonas protegens]|uniref:fimbrial biogenesis chaperone n=1 Tax=Pseudomonas protegens TaxID=380021 RepID=UPI0021B08397|nr:fimbria/pilus periplasmic chaperone [Pseudomonas protegens]
MSRWLGGVSHGRCLWVAVFLMLFGQAAHADLSIVGTRFIYPEGLSALSIRVGNLGSSPLLLQAWLDKGDASVDPSRLAVPFVLSPPLSRLDPQQRAVLSVRYSGDPLPKDRESVFWINALEVPSLQPMDGNQLRFAYRLRMKLLYRPKGLSGTADTAVTQMSWRLRPGVAADAGLTLEARNPTPYFVSLAALEVATERQPQHFQGITVDPFSTLQLPLPGVQARAVGPTEIRYQVATDSGETLSGSVQIHP